MAYNCRGVLDYFASVVGDEDPFPLRQPRGLIDPVLVRAADHRSLKKVIFLGQYESMWPEVEMMAAVDILHPVNSMSEEVFARQLNTLREMIDFLILRQVLEESILD